MLKLATNQLLAILVPDVFDKVSVPKCKISK